MGVIHISRDASRGLASSNVLSIEAKKFSQKPAIPGSFSFYHVINAHWHRFPSSPAKHTLAGYGHHPDSRSRPLDPNH